MSVGDDDEQEPPGHVRVTGPGPLVVLGLVGLVIGWGLRRLALDDGRPSPSVGWTLIGVTWFVLAITAGIAVLTWRTVRTRPRALTPHQGLNRLVLGKTVSRIAAFALGGYLGVAISRIGTVSDNADQVIVRALLAALGAALALAAGLLLEHACRVPPPESPDLP